MSSHYVERLDESFEKHENHRGLDIRGHAALPAGKFTILFFRLADGTTVLKMESVYYTITIIVALSYTHPHSEVGCPPFWKKDFRSVKNALEFGRHTKDFVSTRVLNNAKKGGMKQQRAEYVTVGSKRVFSLALDQLYPNKKSLHTTFDEYEELVVRLFFYIRLKSPTCSNFGRTMR